MAFVCFSCIFFFNRKMARINRGRTSSVDRALKGATSRVAHARILMIISDHLENVGPNFSSNNNNNNNDNNNQI